MNRWLKAQLAIRSAHAADGRCAAANASMVATPWVGLAAQAADVFECAGPSACAAYPFEVVVAADVWRALHVRSAAASFALLLPLVVAALLPRRCVRLAAAFALVPSGLVPAFAFAFAAGLAAAKVGDLFLLLLDAILVGLRLLFGRAVLAGLLFPAGPPEP